MTINSAYSALENIKVGRTTAIAGLVVTRWSEAAYELGTWGRETVTVHEAATKIAGGE